MQLEAQLEEKGVTILLSDKENGLPNEVMSQLTELDLWGVLSKTH